MGEIMRIYGETIFDICYLIIAIVTGVYIIVRYRNKLGGLMGSATLLLGSGDAFHLVPRVLKNFIQYDFTAALGIGKLVTSVTMTIFYILMFYIYKNKFKVENTKKIELSIWILTIIRIILCILPQNNWITNDDGSVMMGIIRNIPFTIMGIIIIVLYYQKREECNEFKHIWINVLLSFLFYLIVVLGTTKVPTLGAFMIPTTVCYILIIVAFANMIKKSEEIYEEI